MDSASLPTPEITAAEITEDLEVALRKSTFVSVILKDHQISRQQ
jgi:hypothetical protein